MRRLGWWAVPCLLWICAAAPVASAVEAPPLPPQSPAPLRWPITFGFELTLGTGIADGSHEASHAGWTAAGSIGAITSLRWRHLRAGVVVDLTGVVFQANELHLGAIAGGTWDVGRSLRLEVLGELGADYVYNIGGQDLFTTGSTGDTTAWLPFAGLRLSAAWHVGSNELIGLWLGVREDLSRATVLPDVTSCLFGCSTSHEEWHAGGTTVTLGFRIGFEQ